MSCVLTRKLADLTKLEEIIIVDVYMYGSTFKQLSKMFSDGKSQALAEITSK